MSSNDRTGLPNCPLPFSSALRYHLLTHTQCCWRAAAPFSPPVLLRQCCVLSSDTSHPFSCALTPTHTHTPERKTDLISISYNRHCISYLHPPPQYTKRSSDSKESPQSFIQLFIVCKTLSSPGSPSTFITGLGGEEGSAIFPFYR